MRNLPPDLESALLGKQVAWLRGRLDATAANSLSAQLLLMAATGGGRTIELYVDSPGGTVDAALTVYDVMQAMSAPVSTTCVGSAGGASVLVLAGGAPGVRFALANARIQLTEETLALPTTRTTDLAAGAAAFTAQVERWRTALRRHTHIADDVLATRFLSAEEAIVLGVIDAIVPPGRAQNR